MSLLVSKSSIKWHVFNYQQVEEKVRLIEVCCDGFFEQDGICVPNCPNEIIMDNSIGTLCNTGKK